MHDYSELMPRMLLGDELEQRMLRFLRYQRNDQSFSKEARLRRLDEIFQVFVPTQMSFDIYHKLYMMCSLSLSQKGTKESIQRLNANHKAIAEKKMLPGTATAASSYSIIGDSGIGKTSSVEISISLLGGILNSDDAMQPVVPAILVTTPFDCNYKGLLYSILLAVDEAIGSDYHTKAEKMNAQRMLGLVSQVCHLHVGVLIVDEIQFLIEHRAGKQLYQMLLQLINASGVCIMLVGTNECIPFFEQAPQIRRRTAGMIASPLGPEEFSKVCRVFFSFQYVKNETVPDDALIFWLYEHTGGNVSTLKCLMHDAQEIAILNEHETLDISTLKEAYDKRLVMMHPYIEASVKRTPQNSRTKAAPKISDADSIPTNTPSISSVVAMAKNNNADALSLLKKYLTIEEVSL